MPQWIRSLKPRSCGKTTQASAPRFSFSSLKDIHDIVREETIPQPGSPRSPSIFHRVKLSVWGNHWSWGHRHSAVSLLPPVVIPNAEHRIIVYFTSLRVVRKTFQDCQTVRSILRGLRVPTDERDLSLDAMFLDELVGIVGQKNLTLPKVFIGGRFIGGAEEIKRLHESGDLYKLVAGLPLLGPIVCDLCDGLGFVLCARCDGSHKIYSQKSGFRSCNICNENGLIRCPSCSRMLRQTTL
ncbi:hypothetical protein SLE2022_072130 [Rubroshorea leprosula]